VGLGVYSVGRGVGFDTHVLLFQGALQPDPHSVPLIQSQVQLSSDL
jgi:hypothetical protein